MVLYMNTNTDTQTTKTFPAGTPCMCPGDCNCQAPEWMHRMVFCGCRQH